MSELTAIEEALAELPAAERVEAAAPAMVALVFDALALDEDELNAAARRGLLLAAAAGNPAESCSPGSRAALETAADLAADGYAQPLMRALGELVVPPDCPLISTVVAGLLAAETLALEALAVVVLHRAIA